MEGETGGYGTVGRWTDGQIKLEILGEFMLIWRFSPNILICRRPSAHPPCLRMVDSAKIILYNSKYPLRRFPMCSKRYIKYYSFADAYTEAIKDNPIKNDSTRDKKLDMDYCRREFRAFLEKLHIVPYYMKRVISICQGLFRVVHYANML